MEAPPGFEPGMEVLQGHLRLFSRERSLAAPLRNPTCSIDCADFSLRPHRVRRWLNLDSVGSPRTQSGHSSRAHDSGDCAYRNNVIVQNSGRDKKVLLPNYTDGRVRYDYSTGSSLKSDHFWNKSNKHYSDDNPHCHQQRQIQNHIS